ncbi:MAG TPA: hypothetical protein VGC76_02385 [Pyrinomonadaceae bacterium]|jgi:hypothetical protein
MNVIYNLWQKSPANFFYKSLRLCVPALIIFFCLHSIQAQSIDQNFPTPVTSNEINGKIPARDLGDARLTNYFYVFNGSQGDVFINVVTKNLDGDIDIFTADNLRPLTKIRVYSDNSDNETGRIVYLRQAEKLILRIEGRTPNDEAATFRIKFAGSFEPLKAVAKNEDQNSPAVKTENQGEVRVNSVGTIIEVKPKPTPKPVVTKEEKTETVAENKAEKKEKIEAKKTESKKTETAEKKEKKKSEKNVAAEETTPPIVVVTDKIPKSEKADKKEEKTEDTKAESENAAKTKKKSTKAEKTVEPNPLENIKLIVLFKDGTKIESPMSEILRVNVDKGILTIIRKDGSVGRYSILDVEQMTIK